MRYWVRWASDYPLETFEYHGPWWVSGWDSDDRPIVCAAVCAEAEDHAQRVIAASYDTEPDLEFDFVDQCEDYWEPFSGRFPQADWMVWPMPSGSTGRPDRGRVQP